MPRAVPTLRCAVMARRFELSLNPCPSGDEHNPMLKDLERLDTGLCAHCQTICVTRLALPHVFLLVCPLDARTQSA